LIVLAAVAAGFFLHPLATAAVCTVCTVVMVALFMVA
jgi:hypothetical protein